MRSIADLFSKIKHLQAQKIAAHIVVQEVVKKHSKVELELGSISFRGSDLVIKKVSSAAKSQIFIKKRNIIEEIASKGLSQKVDDIAF